MDFFDNAVNKAKEAIDIACKKTNEVVSTGKNKFDIASLENKRAKDFEKLGEIYFNLVKDTEIDSPETKSLVESVLLKNTQIKALKDEVNSAKNKRTCPNCGESVADTSTFCSACGAKLVIDSEE